MCCLFFASLGKAGFVHGIRVIKVDSTVALFQSTWSRTAETSITNASQEGENSLKTLVLLESKPLMVFDVHSLGIGDHPGMSLGSVPLTTTNYLVWS